MRTTKCVKPGLVPGFSFRDIVSVEAETFEAAEGIHFAAFGKGSIPRAWHLAGISALAGFSFCERSLRQSGIAKQPRRTESRPAMTQEISLIALITVAYILAGFVKG